MSKQAIMKHLHSLTPDWFDQDCALLTVKKGGCTVITIQHFETIGRGKRNLDQLNDFRRHARYQKDIG